MQKGRLIPLRKKKMEGGFRGSGGQKLWIIKKKGEKRGLGKVA